MSSPASPVVQSRPHPLRAVVSQILVALGLGVLGGLAWGLLRPQQTVQVQPLGALALVDGNLAAGFLAVMYFLAVTAVIALYFGISMSRGQFLATPRAGLPVLFQAGIMALLSSLIVLAVGQVVAGLRQPDLAALQVGQEALVVPLFDTYQVLILPPLVAMMGVWTRILVQDDKDEPSQAQPSQAQASQAQASQAQPEQSQPAD